MSFTRYKYDKLRVQKQLNESTFTGRYMLNTPGNGSVMPFQEDPHLRLQQWGANMASNAIQLESDLRGLNRKLTKDCNETNNYITKQSPLNNISYGTNASFVHQSRAEMPAWEVKGAMPVRETYLHYDPQNPIHLSMGFHNNLSTRILEKDMYLESNNN